MFVQLFELIKLNIVHLSGILIYCLEGLALAAAGYKLFQFIIPLKPYEEMGDREKVGVAIMVAGLVVGMSIIVAQTSLEKPPVIVNIPTIVSDYYRSLYSPNDNQPLPENMRAQKQGGCGAGCGNNHAQKKKPQKVQSLPEDASTPSSNRPVDENIWLNANPLEK